MLGPSSTSPERTRTLSFTSPPSGEVGFPSPLAGEGDPGSAAAPVGWGRPTGNTASGIFGSLAEFVEPLAKQVDRINVGLGIDAEVDQERTLRPFRGVERRRDVLESLDP